MLIQYIAPLSRGWNRMKKALFRPFDISKWFTLGFAVFLADLMEFHGGGSGSSGTGRGQTSWHEFFNFPYVAWDWLNSHPFWFALILLGLFFFFLLLIFLTWLSSRGKFIFLDNVIFDRAMIVKPWSDFNLLGNSLFLWRLVFGFISLILFTTIIIIGFVLSYNYYLGYYNLQTIILIGAGFFFLGLLIFLVTSYISLFLNDFVVPLMHKHRIKTNQAWRIFLKLFNMNAGYFFLYGLFVFALLICAIMAILIFGFVTCCCGFILLVIPYISSVLLLPVSYTFRALSLEFLEQFGAEYKIFPDAIENNGSI